MAELTWSGKALLPAAPASLRTVATVYPAGRGYPRARPKSRLIHGENLGVMAGLLPEYEASIDLIYADPPFFSNRNYKARIGRGEDSRKPAKWAVAEGYGDSWPDLDSYLQFLYQRLAMMHKLLSPTGTLYLHLDWHADSHARLLLDELFGPGRLLNEIVWTYHGPSPIRSAFNRKHDTILAYTKSDDYVFHADAVRQPYDPATIRTFKSSRKAGFGKVPDLARGKVPEDWWYFPVVARLHGERTGYPTQKPEALLERIIKASSSAGDLVADFFSGSGTAAGAAAKLGRRFIAVDESTLAVETSRARLAALNAAPFTVESAIDEPLPIKKSPKLVFEVAKGSLRILRPTSFLAWEVDPDWDGKTFRSKIQVRQLRSGAPGQSAVRIGTGRRACVRLVTPTGSVLQAALDL